jgi:hypothetical protein
MARERLHHTCTSTSCANKSATLVLLGFSPITLPIKFVAAEAGFLPPGPAVDFADIVTVYIRALRDLEEVTEEDAFEKSRTTRRMQL